MTEKTIEELKAEMDARDAAAAAYKDAYDAAYEAAEDAEDAYVAARIAYLNALEAQENHDA